MILYLDDRGTAPKPHNMKKMGNKIVPTYKWEKHHVTPVL
jgi:hypothetical protein